MDTIDDPYKILASNLVAELSEKELHEILHNAKTVKKRIVREVNNADFYGNFLDCIMVELVKHNRERELHRNLTEVSEFFYRNIDIPRLRANVRYYCEKYGKSI